MATTPQRLLQIVWTYEGHEFGEDVFFFFCRKWFVRPKLRAWMGHMLMMMLSVDLGLMMGHRSTLSYVDHVFRHSYIRQTDSLAIYYNMYSHLNL